MYALARAYMYTRVRTARIQTSRYFPRSRKSTASDRGANPATFRPLTSPRFCFRAREQAGRRATRARARARKKARVDGCTHKRCPLRDRSPRRACPSRRSRARRSSRSSSRWRWRWRLRRRLRTAYLTRRRFFRERIHTRGAVYTRAGHRVPRRTAQKHTLTLAQAGQAGTHRQPTRTLSRLGRLSFVRE